MNTIIPFLKQACAAERETVQNHPDGVTRERVQSRAREIAVLAGRTPPHVLQADYEQAKRELTGVSDLARQEAILDSIAPAGGNP